MPVDEGFAATPFLTELTDRASAREAATESPKEILAQICTSMLFGTPGDERHAEKRGSQG